MAQELNTVNLKFSLLARVVFALFLIVLCVALGRLVIAQFVIDVFNDPRTTLTKAELQSAAAYYPNSSILQSLLAESEMTEAADHEGTSARAVSAATRAVNLSPWRYELRLLLAAAQELSGDRAAAEASLREAIRLAPNNAEVHWRLANLLVRESRLGAALDHFRSAVTANPAWLPSALNLVWEISGGRFETVDAVAGARPEVRLRLALFLLKRERLEEATQVFSGIDRQARLQSAETANFLSALTSAGKAEQSRRLWAELATQKTGADLPLIWNSGFEENLTSVQSGFDWRITSSKYAAVVIDPDVGRTGLRSLRMDFAGIDTTTLDGEFKQSVLVRPGARYRLECFVKTGNLVIPATSTSAASSAASSEGLRLVVVDSASSSPVAMTAPINAGTSDWRPLSVDFVAPADVKTDAKMLEIRIRRRPRFSYDEPASGVIWFDDFSLTEAPNVASSAKSRGQK